MPASECFSCLVEIARRAIQLSTSDVAFQKRLEHQLEEKIAAAFPTLQLPDFSTELFADIARATGVADPFLEVKALSNRSFLELLPTIEARLAQLPSSERLRQLFLYTIAGNMVDFSTGGHRLSLPEILEQFFTFASEPLVIDDFALLSKSLAAAENIILLSDNCGEVVLDNFLAGYLVKEFGKRVFLGLKGAPVANDCTLDDFRRDGLPFLATETFAVSDAFGYNLHEVSPRFKALLSHADLLLVKGQSNYETTVNNLVRFPEFPFPPTFSILRTKCVVISRHLGVPLGSNVIKRMFPREGRRSSLTEITTM